MKNKEENITKVLRQNIRLNTPSPKVIKDKSKYNRKEKHKKQF